MGSFTNVRIRGHQQMKVSRVVLDLTFAVQARGDTEANVKSTTLAAPLRRIPAKQREEVGMVNSRRGESDVNPLTRPSRRSVMQFDHSVAVVEGAAATSRSTACRTI